MAHRCASASRSSLVGYHVGDDDWVFGSAHERAWSGADTEHGDDVRDAVWGVINFTRAALPVPHRQRAGHIIQFSSIGGREGSPALGAYQLSKFAVAGSPRLAAEVPPLGIKVAIIKPGGFRTDWAGPRCRPRRALDPTTSGPSGR